MTAKKLISAPLSILVALSLSACSTFSPKVVNEDVVQQEKLATAGWRSKAEDLQKTVLELRSENTRLTRTVQSLKRDQQKAQSVRASIEKEAEEKAALEAAKAERLEVLVVPPPPKNPESIIVAEAEAAPLSPSAVPVESTPRLVEPSFAAVEAVFENEAGTSIETTSVLFGVHLASYRKTAEAITGWKNLQRDNPNLLGLLEPRVEKVTIEGRGEFFRLIAGGFSSQAKAIDLCFTLKKKKLYCASTNFKGKRLEIPAAG